MKEIQLFFSYCVFCSQICTVYFVLKFVPLDLSNAYVPQLLVFVSLPLLLIHFKAANGLSNPGYIIICILFMNHSLSTH
jgi:hypothetical protein